MRYEFDDDNVIIASSLGTLFDLTKTCGARGKHIHCQFPYRVYEQGLSLEKEIAKCGIRSLYFSEVGLIQFND